MPLRADGMNSVRFLFTGAMSPASFEQFARHRAARLSLAIAIGASEERFFDVTVSGDEALVDMFEMACSLGPYDCIIMDVARHDADPFKPT
jgi:hypothetical protein